MLGELSPTQIDYLLRTEVTGRLGCSAEGRIYVVPISYVYDGQSIFAFTREGMKLEIMRKNPQVCFQVDHLNNMSNWRSVIAWGTFEELHGEEASEALQILRNKFSPIPASETSIPPAGFKPSLLKNGETKYRDAVLFKIKVTEKTGRFEKR